MTAYTVSGIPIWMVAFGLMLFPMQDVQQCPLIERRRAISIVLLALSALTAEGIILALYISFTPVGEAEILGVQSKYFIPILFPIFCSIVMLAKTNPNVTRLTTHHETRRAHHLRSETTIYLIVYYVLILHAYSVWLPF